MYWPGAAQETYRRGVPGRGKAAQRRPRTASQPRVLFIYFAVGSSAPRMHARRVSALA